MSTSILHKSVKNPSSKPNQDRHLIWVPDADTLVTKNPTIDNKYGVFAILDGHGSEYDIGGFSAETVKSF